MKIKPKKVATVVRRIESGKAWIDGRMSDGGRYPEGDEYWVVVDATNQATWHVLVDDAPDLDKVKEV